MVLKFTGRKHKQRTGKRRNTIRRIPVIIYNKIIIRLINKDDDARRKDPILLPKIPIGMRKNFFENYRQFEYALSKMFASPDIGSGNLLHNALKCVTSQISGAKEFKDRLN
jgi:hypothetical protein